MSLSRQSSKDENQKITLITYERGVETYAKNTRGDISDSLKQYLDHILTQIPPGAKILEIGSATGRDATYIESRGYDITRSDAVKGFVTKMQNDGYEAIQFNVLSDVLPKTYDAIIATAVLLHMTVGQFSTALNNISVHLNTGGTLVIAVKQGEGEEYSTHKMGSKRFFKYWIPKDLEKIVENHGFTVVECSSLGSKKWLTCIARR
jgi:cyclopropane fatty-acyl-phospholipid synthase-like methyltransferase